MIPAPYIRIDCSSILAPYIKEYIELKRTFGFKYNPETQILNRFDRFCADNKLATPSISAQLLEMWGKPQIGENETTQQLRIRVVRGFSLYMNRIGLQAPAAFHPLPVSNEKFIPHIFTQEEIVNLFQTIDSICAKQRTVSPIRHLVIPVLFRVIYGCGLRLSEALSLKKENVDVSNQSIKVTDAKGNQDRIVIMSDSLVNICSRYLYDPEIQSFESVYLFPAPDHNRYANRTIYSFFRSALFAAGIPHRGRGHGPRVHDLRHTFAVNVLSKWQSEGRDIYVCLPILSTYLGHKNILSTERYLQLVPERYGQVTGAFDTTFKNVFPEVLS